MDSPPSHVAAAWTSPSTRRTIVLLSSISVGLASGSNYVYSAYAPQLASQLDINSTMVNLVGTAGNFGMYIMGPLFGKLVDAKGQRIPLLISAACVSIGYLVVHSFYTLTIAIRPTPNSPPSIPRLCLLAFAMFLTGSGGCGGLSASINAVAKSFPDKTRASATGVVLAGFGLSAFLFSTIAHVCFPGDAGGLLLVLAIGTSLPMLLGSILINPVPPIEDAEERGYERLEQDPQGAHDPRLSIDEPYLSRSNSLELTRSRSPTRRHPFTSSRSPTPPAKPSANHSRSTSLASLPPTAISYAPLDLLVSQDFWLLFVVLGLLCGTGLMYINNVGSVALALARDGKLEYDRKMVGGWQARMVGTVSVWNCLGRIIGGMASDFAKTKYHIRRIWFLPLVCLLFISSQLLALATTSVKHLWAVSTALGLAYGMLFNVVPMLTLEWFGMAHFSQNYGWMCVAPVIGGNMFNLIFGRVYDSNTVGRVGVPDSTQALDAKLVRRAGGVTDGQHDCLLGEQCYGSAFKISCIACILALGLSIYAGIRRERMARAGRSGS